MENSKTGFLAKFASQLIHEGEDKRVHNRLPKLDMPSHFLKNPNPAMQGCVDTIKLILSGRKTVVCCKCKKKITMASVDNVI